MEFWVARARMLSAAGCHCTTSIFLSSRASIASGAFSDVHKLPSRGNLQILTYSGNKIATKFETCCKNKKIQTAIKGPLTLSESEEESENFLLFAACTLIFFAFVLTFIWCVNDDLNEISRSEEFHFGGSYAK